MTQIKTRRPISETAPAWAFVLQHKSTLTRFAERQYHPSFEFRGVSREDFRGELVLDVVEHFGAYDPSRAGASTWLWWRVLCVRLKLLRYGARIGHEVQIEVKTDEESPLRGGSARYQHAASRSASAEALVLLSEVFERATPLEEEALVAVADRLGRVEVFSELGISMSEVQSRIESLRRRCRSPLCAR